MPEVPGSRRFWERGRLRSYCPVSARLPTRRKTQADDDLRRGHGGHAAAPRGCTTRSRTRGSPSCAPGGYAPRRRSTAAPCWRRCCARCWRARRMPHPVATSAHFLRVPQLAPGSGRGDLAQARPDGVDRAGHPGPGRQGDPGHHGDDRHRARSRLAGAGPARERRLGRWRGYRRAAKVPAS